ncbi:unnamed protein product [Strongylus vulgaris]|uniref:Uncharacterized protein n=1 Tax=Strongylus vulgaris TaxID=40348 RepID=A0A3P7K981_STRVU|nr:unnamed protein product [Strongylus vulgaris]
MTLFFSRNIPEAETILKELNEVGKRIRLRINRKKKAHEERFLEDQEMELECSPTASDRRSMSRLREPEDYAKAKHR